MGNFTGRVDIAGQKKVKMLFARLRLQKSLAEAAGTREHINKSRHCFIFPIRWSKVKSEAVKGMRHRNKKSFLYSIRKMPKSPGKKPYPSAWAGDQSDFLMLGEKKNNSIAGKKAKAVVLLKMQK